MWPGLLLGAEIAKTLIEARNLTVGIDDPVLTCPCRMRLGIDIKLQHIAFLPQVDRVLYSEPSVITTVISW